MNPSAFDRIKTYLSRIIDGQTRRMDYLALYPCKVVSQGNDDTLELQPDDARIPGLSKVAIRHGLPGVRVKVAAGVRVLLGFENGDPSLPFAALWQFDGSSIQELHIGNNPSEYVALATKTKQALDDIISAFGTHTHTGVQTGSGSSGPPASPITTTTDVASATVKST